MVSTKGPKRLRPCVFGPESFSLLFDGRNAEVDVLLDVLFNPTHLRDFTSEELQGVNYHCETKKRCSVVTDYKVICT